MIKAELTPARERIRKESAATIRLRHPAFGMHLYKRPVMAGARTLGYAPRRQLRGV